MKKLDNYILEALIKKDTKIGTNIDVDHLIKDNFTLYDDTDPDCDDQDWEDCKNNFDEIDSKYDFFLCCRDQSLMKLKNYNNIKNVTVNLDGIIRTVITGNDYGYAVRMSYGHIEIDCINSGSRRTYYVYAISEKAYDEIDSYLWGDMDESDFDISFIYNEKDVIPIKI